MSTLMAPEEALSLIPGWDPSRTCVTRLPGGLTNRSFRVDRDSRSYLLRLDAEHTAVFGLDRVTELAILERAAAAGLAPEVLFADPQAGVMLSMFLGGNAWTDRDLNDDRNLESLAKLLRQVHALPLSGVEFDAPAIARRYAANLDSDADLRAFAQRCVAVVADAPPLERHCCCHNDLVAGNVIATPELRLIDWEYACDNEPLFDLASLIGFHDLDQARVRTLLVAYAGDASRRDELEAQVRVYDAIQWLWLANRQRISHDPALAARLPALQNRIG